MNFNRSLVFLHIYRTMKNTTINITPGELSVGMFVMITDVKPFNCTQPVQDTYDAPEDIIKTIGTINSNVANEAHCSKTVLHVRALDLPYAVMLTCANSSFVIDIRKCNLIELTDEFVRAFDPAFFDRCQQFMLTIKEVVPTVSN